MHHTSHKIDDDHSYMYLIYGICRCIDSVHALQMAVYVHVLYLIHYNCNNYYYRKLLFGFGMMKIKSYENCLHSCGFYTMSCKNENFVN